MCRGYRLCLTQCFPLQKYVSELSTVRDCVETCVEKGKQMIWHETIKLLLPPSHGIFLNLSWNYNSMRKIQFRFGENTQHQTSQLQQQKFHLSFWIKMNIEILISIVGVALIFTRWAFSWRKHTAGGKQNLCQFQFSYYVIKIHLQCLGWSETRLNLSNAFNLNFTLLF